MSNSIRSEFLDVAAQWLCKGYFLDIRYLTLRSADKEQLCGAVLALNPREARVDVQFQLDIGQLRAGQIQCRAPSEMMDILKQVCAGRLAIGNLNVALPETEKLDYYTDNGDPNKSGLDLHLRVLGSQHVPFSAHEVRAIETQLRRASPPFDGFADLCGWLGVQNPAHFGTQATINIHVNPPVDMGDDLQLAADTLKLNFRALSDFAPAALKLGVRVMPGEGLPRYQLASEIVWHPAKEGIKEGTLEFKARRADVAQFMLTLGGHTIRRHVLVDRSRARTLRLAAVMSLDPNLEQLRVALRSTGRDRDAARFEKAVATLLFLYGFTPTPHVDPDGPDLLVTSPGGRLAIVECTLKVSDFNGKVSKLAGRRNRLLSELAAKEHAADVHSVLVCASLRDEILGIDDVELARQSVMLVTAEGLLRAIEDVQSPPDPDDLLARASAALLETQSKAQSLNA